MASRERDSLTRGLSPEDVGQLRLMLGKRIYKYNTVNPSDVFGIKLKEVSRRGVGSWHSVSTTYRVNATDSYPHTRSCSVQSSQAAREISVSFFSVFETFFCTSLEIGLFQGNIDTQSDFLFLVVLPRNEFFFFSRSSFFPFVSSCNTTTRLDHGLDGAWPNKYLCTENGIIS